MTTRMIAPMLALAALATAQGAQAQQRACVNAADFADGVIYAMPLAFDATRTACANRLDRSGFIATRGDAYIADFRAGQNRAWPGALRLLKTFMEKPGDSTPEADMSAIIANLPDDALRPFVDALVGQMIAKEIKGDSCGKIERVLELVSPLPTENVGGLVAFIAEVTELKDPPICGPASAAAPPRAAGK